MTRRRRAALILLAALLLATPPAIAAAATHWHQLRQPVHYDRSGVWLGTPFPFTIDFRGTTQVSGCLHTDIVQYREWVTGASDVHYLRHAHC
jgi:hypothetical protein